ncbi:MAG: DUF2853 family protein [Actinobacteria bacterium]|nr:DUF2853 family protein [Actinomycetota bacterium]MCB9389607.1 DUF2853 family protein [Acidimicrobiia bacterium]
MSKFDDVIEASKTQMTEHDIAIDETLLRAVAKGLGPTIYRADSSIVAAGDAEEMARVKNNFLIKKLGCDDDAKMDDALRVATQALGQSNPRKLRTVFYYVLVTELGKQSVYQ